MNIFFYTSNNFQTNNRNKNPKFKAHPDFNRLSERYNLTASTYFRRGKGYDGPDEGFVDIIKIFIEKLGVKLPEPQKILIAGIGNSQEPFSYLAVIKDLFQNKKLTEVLDLHTIDLQAKPKNKKLKIDSFLDFGNRAGPEFAKTSFVEDDASKYGGFYFQKHRVIDEIFNYLKSVYENKNKALWEKRLQESIKDYPNKYFDIVSINNTIPYIENRCEIEETLRNVVRVLKDNGVFITDPYKFDWFETSGILDNLKEVKAGIFKKVE